MKSAIREGETMIRSKSGVRPITRFAYAKTNVPAKISLVSMNEPIRGSVEQPKVIDGINTAHARGDRDIQPNDISTTPSTIPIAMINIHAHPPLC
jgi:hypothetical protein